MDGQSVGELWYRVLALRDELYRLSISMLGDRSAFEDVSLRLPRDTPYELAFYQTVSWLYVLYVETGPRELAIYYGTLSNIWIGRGGNSG